MRRLITKALVTTISAVACGGCGKSDRSQSPPAPVVDAAPSAEPVVATRLRKRTHPASYAPADGKRPVGGELLNPRDAQGRVIFTRPDDVCMVEGTPKEPRPQSLPPGLPWRSLERIDCPPAMDDPAWDDCPDRLVRDEGTGTCACVSSYGDPPPPARPNARPEAGKKPAEKGS